MRYRGKHQARKHRRWLWFLLALVLLFLIGYPFAEPYMLEVEQVTLSSSDLPKNIGQLKIVYLSDIHQGAFFSASRVREIFTRVNSLSPDIVLLGGDYAEGAESAVVFFESLPSINARYLTAAVVGEHERSEAEESLEALTKAMYNANVTPLINSVARVKIGSDTICLAGIDDEETGLPDVEEVAAQVSGDEFVVFLSHSPAVLSEVLDARDANGSKNWFDLALCGHTHGGQITLLGQPLLEIARTSGRYWQGWYEANRAAVLVSNGVGTSVVPMRLFTRPQIHLITVRSE